MTDKKKLMKLIEDYGDHREEAGWSRAKFEGGLYPNVSAEENEDLAEEILQQIDDALDTDKSIGPFPEAYVPCK
jgi:hypothetical protein